MAHIEPVSRPWTASLPHCRMLHMGIAMVLGASMLGDANALPIHIPPILKPTWRKIPPPIHEPEVPLHPAPEPTHPTPLPPLPEWRPQDLDSLTGSKKSFSDIVHARPPIKSFENIELLSESTQRQALLEQNERTGMGTFALLYVTLESDPVANGIYRVEYHGSKPKHMNSMKELAAEISRIGKARPDQSVALVVDGPAGVKSMRALQMSLEQWSPGMQTPIVLAEDFRLLLNMGEPVTLHSLGVTYWDQAVEGGMRLKQDISLGNSSWSPRMSIYARSQEVLDKFIQILLSLPKELNVMLRVYLAQMQTADALHKSLAEIKGLMTVEFQELQLAQWCKPELDSRMFVALAGQP